VTTAGPYGQWRADTLVLRCRALPGARRDAFLGACGDRLKLGLAAPPVDGKANARAIEFLAAAFGVPKSRVTLVRGTHGRDKVFAIAAPTRLPAEALVAGFPP
jgi:hypothetical protein